MFSLKLSTTLVVSLLLVAAVVVNAVPEPIRAAMHFTLNDAISPLPAADAATPPMEHYQHYAIDGALSNVTLTPGDSEAHCSGGANGGTDPTGNECTTLEEVI